MILLLTKGGPNAYAVAKVFQAHNVWFGKCMQPDMLSPDSGLQNLEITAALEAFYGNNHNHFPAHQEKSGFMAKVCDALEAQGYQGEDLAIMCHGVYKDSFNSFSPFKVAITDPLHENICPHLENIPYQINTQDVLDRNFNILKYIFTHCRITFDERLANDTLDQTL